MKENTLGKDEDNDVATPSVAPNINLGKSVPSSVDNRLEAGKKSNMYLGILKFLNVEINTRFTCLVQIVIYEGFVLFY